MLVRQGLISMNDLTREIVFTPAFDKRSKDPSKNYGVHGVEMKWFLKGPKGAIQFVVFTNWMLPHVQAERDADCSVEKAFLHKPMPADLGYHSPHAMYDGQQAMADDCPVIGGKCYYDGSGLNAYPVFQLLLEKGSEAVWQRLEEEYHERFDEKGTP